MENVVTISSFSPAPAAILEFMILGSLSKLGVGE